MGITISGAGHHEYNELEITACDYIVNQIKYGNKSDFALDKRAGAYTTIMYKSHLLVNLKFGTKAKWVDVLVDDQSKYDGDDRFEKKSKTQYMKASFNSLEDLDKYVDVIEDTCNYLDESCNWGIDPIYVSLIKKY